MQRNIDFGTFPDDPDADAIRTAFQKVQQNFTDLYSGSGAGVTSIVAGQGIQLGGTGSATGAVTIEAAIACIQVQSSTLSLGVLGSSSDEGYVLIPSSSQVLTVDLPANIVADNLELSGNLSVSGDIDFGNSVTANYFIGNGVFLTGLSAGNGTAITNGTSNVIVDLNSIVRTSVSGNANVFVVTGNGANVNGNLGVSGKATIGSGSGGNISGANVVSANVFIATASANLGNSVTANFFIGNGSLLTGIAVGNSTAIINGTSNVIVDANANVRTSVAGTSNVFVVTSGGANVTGNLGVSGNLVLVTGGNISGADVISANVFIATASANLGNSVTANFFIGNGSLLTGIAVGNSTAIINGSSNVIVDANADVRISVAGTSNVFVVTVGGANVTGNLGVSGNATIGSGSGGNLTGANVISANVFIATASANLGNSVTANFFIGNGSLLTGLPAGSSLVSGNSNIVVNSSSNITMATNGAERLRIITDGNVGIGISDPTSKLHVSGTSNITGEVVLGSTLNVTGNANVGNIGAINGVFTSVGGTLTTNAQPNITSVGTLSSLAVTGNATANYFYGNLFTIVTRTGNVVVTNNS